MERRRARVVGAFVAHAEQFFAVENFFLSEKFVAIERVTNGLFENLDVRQMRIAFKRVNAGSESGEARAQRALVGIGDRNAGPRDNQDLAPTLTARARPRS